MPVASSAPVRACASRLLVQAGGLAPVVQPVASVFTAASWQGAAADVFAVELHVLRREVDGVVTELGDIGRRLHQRADQLAEDERRQPDQRLPVRAV